MHVSKSLKRKKLTLDLGKSLHLSLFKQTRKHMAAKSGSPTDLKQVGCIT